MNARCWLLATRYPTVPAYQCPTDHLRFHYHAHQETAPYRPMVGGRPCAHRHTSPQAAIRCAVGPSEAGRIFAAVRALSGHQEG